jgi:hypothetical protein
MFTVRHYLSEEERDPFQEWLKKLRDPIAKIQVVKRVNRIEGGKLRRSQVLPRRGLGIANRPRGRLSRLLRNVRCGDSASAMRW